jgi:hypothetical protein
VAHPPLAGRPAQIAAAADPTHPSEQRPLAGSPLDWYADIYYTAARVHHWTPGHVDALEVWEFYAAVGHALSDGEWQRLQDPPPKQRRGRRGRRRSGHDEQVASRGRDLTAERVAYLQGRGPKPEPDDKPDPRLAQIIRSAPGTPNGTT